MAFCMGCGAELPEDDQFCASCGRPAAGGSRPAATAGASGGGSVTVPLWLAEGWGSAAGRALGAGAIGVAIQYAIGLVLAFGVVALAQGSSFGASSIDWGQILKNPFFMWLGMHGAVEGAAMWLTSIVWIVVSFHLAGRFGLSGSRVASQDGSPLLSSAIYAFKAALIYATAVVVFLVVFEPTGATFNSAINTSGFAVAWEPAGAFFSTVFVAFLAVWGLDTYARRSDESGDGAVGLVRSALGGTVTILSVGIIGLLVFVLIGGVLETLDSGTGILGWIGGVLITMLVAIVFWAGIDVGMALMGSAMQFFRDDTAGGFAQGILGDPGWLIAGSAIVVVAFAWGGYRAARSTGSKDLNRLLQASGLAGLGVALAFTLASFVVGSRIEEIKSGIGLSLLWAIVALGGGLIYAQSVGVLESALPTIAAAQGADVGKACANCGTGLPKNAAFCAKCGSAAA